MKHSKLAQFRVDRMTGIQSADTSFGPVGHVRRSFGMYHEETHFLQLECQPFHREFRGVKAQVIVDFVASHLTGEKVIIVE